MKNVDLIPGLENLDPIAAAGVLSRMAVGIQSEGLNPAAIPRINDEEVRRSKLYGFAVNELSGTDPSLILDWLDHLLDEVSEPVDKSKAMKRLNSDGAIPTDAFVAKFDSYQPWSLAASSQDKEHASVTVRYPEYSELFGPEFHPGLISLLGRWFGQGRSKHLLIVVGFREDDLDFQVVEILRLYPDIIRLYPMVGLSVLVERFANHYGALFSVSAFEGHFLRNISFVGDIGRYMIKKAKYPGDHRASFLAKKENGVTHVSFGMCINVDRYNHDVRRRGDVFASLELRKNPL